MRPGLHLCIVAALLSVSACGKSPTAPSPPPVACTFQLSAPAQSFGPDAASVTVTVTTAAQCSWTARAEGGWLSIASGTSGTGPGAIQLALAGNDTDAAREGTLIVADQSLKFTQAGREPCQYALSSDFERVGPNGGEGSFTLTTGAGCTWTANTTDSWISVSPDQGTGSATLRYTVLPWAGTLDREAAIRLADRQLTIRQERNLGACTYSVSPVEFTLHWHGQTLQIELNAQPGCPWTAVAAADWLTTSGPSSGEGDATLIFTAGAFTPEAGRRAPVEVRWPTPTAGQNVWVTQEGCRYGISETARTFPAEGGTAMVTVLTQAVSWSCAIPCPWTAEPSVPWIRIVSQMPRAGDDPFRYEVLPNPGPGSRVGVIRVADRTLTITQF